METTLTSRQVYARSAGFHILAVDSFEFGKFCRGAARAEHGARNIVVGLDVGDLLGEHHIPSLALVERTQLHQGQVWNSAIDVEQDNRFQK